MTTFTRDEINASVVIRQDETLKYTVVADNERVTVTASYDQAVEAAKRAYAELNASDPESKHNRHILVATGLTGNDYESL